MILKTALFLSLVTSAFADPVTISGTVHNHAGKPIKKAAVTLRNMKDEILMEETTSRKGKFFFKKVEPKFYFLVIEHEGEGTKRIKINPRKTRNRDLVLRLELTGEDEPVQCYLFSNNKPTDVDPILKVKGLNAKPSAEHIIITWMDIKQAMSFIL
ncbi:MAG TPA: carboxypeptidase regulatory-like domain-containing protein, partial [Candidatus Marinimicrobia bacterium]|nr:carboxypeptidase regulatory-like domain-containing protein [Candidatus Neomarinimicrobiota bacterium]